MQEQHAGRSVGRVTEAADRVPWSERAGLMLGALASTGTWGTLGVLKDPFFTVILGVNPAVLSTIFFVQRLWDACIDPLIGQYSDNFRSRWGRRKPLLVVGAPLMTGCFAALWWFPAGASPTVVAIALAITSLLFAACFTLYSMPLAGLTMEATGDYHERTRIAGLVGVAAFAFSIAIQWIFPLAQSALFSDTVSGIRWVTGACAVLFLGCALAPVVLCRERTYAQAAAQPPMPLLPSLRTALTCAPLRTLLTMRLVFTLCYSVVQQFAFFMNLYYVFGGKVAPALWAFASMALR